MTNDSDGRGTLYESVLEYARREIDEATQKIAELQRSVRLLEARVEAAKSVYEAVAARLNLEEEAEGVFHETPYPEPPRQAPEPPETAVPQAEAGKGAEIVDMDLIRQHLARKQERTPAPVAPAPQAPPEGPASSFSLDLIRRHLEERGAREQGATGAREMARPSEPRIPGAAEGEPANGGLSPADRELIGAYLRSKQGS